MTTFAPVPRELRTERLLLRPWRLSDSTLVRQLWSERDPRSSRLLDADGHPTVAEMRNRIAYQLAESESTGLRLWAIERAVDPGFVGYCGLTVGAGTLAEPEIAYELFSAVQWQGIATEAAHAVVEIARSTGRSRLWATVREWNVASFAVLDKLGFSDSGRRTVDEARGDSVWMTLDLAAPGGDQQVRKT